MRDAAIQRAEAEREGAQPDRDDDAFDQGAAQRVSASAAAAQYGHPVQRRRSQGPAASPSIAAAQRQVQRDAAPEAGAAEEAASVLSPRALARAQRANPRYQRRLGFEPAELVPGADIASEQFAEATAQYQAQGGLQVDGIAGPQTCGHAGLIAEEAAAEREEASPENEAVVEEAAAEEQEAPAAPARQLPAYRGFSEPRSMVVTAGTLNVRAEPDRDATKVGEYARGTPIGAEGRAGGWLAVEHEGQRAYIHRRFVRRAEPPAAVAGASEPAAADAGAAAPPPAAVASAPTEAPVAADASNAQIAAGLSAKHAAFRAWFETVQPDASRIAIWRSYSQFAVWLRATYPDARDLGALVTRDNFIRWAMTPIAGIAAAASRAGGAASRAAARRGAERASESQAARANQVAAGTDAAGRGDGSNAVLEHAAAFNSIPVWNKDDDESRATPAARFDTPYVLRSSDAAKGYMAQPDIARIRNATIMRGPYEGQKVSSLGQRPFIGKGTPLQVQTIAQACIDNGLITPSELQAFINAGEVRTTTRRGQVRQNGKWGVDCSGFAGQISHLMEGREGSGQDAVAGYKNHGARTYRVNNSTGRSAGSGFVPVSPEDARAGDMVSMQSSNHVMVVVASRRVDLPNERNSSETRPAICLEIAESTAASTNDGSPGVGNIRADRRYYYIPGADKVLGGRNPTGHHRRLVSSWDANLPKWRAEGSGFVIPGRQRGFVAHNCSVVRNPRLADDDGEA